MKRAILCGIFLVSFSKAFAQASPDSLISSLVNAVYLERVNPAAKFYYLYKKGENLDLNKIDIVPSDFLNEKELLKDVPVNELLVATKQDTTSIDWSNYNLVSAKCVLKPPVRYSYSVKITKIVPFNAPDSMVQRLRNEGIIPVRLKSSISNKQYDKLTKKALERYEKDTPIENKNFYFFSKPVFSKNRQYALIALNGSGRGCLYIFKLSEGKWIKVYQFNCWVV